MYFKMFSRCRYICTICSRVFCRRALLRRHHAVHSGFKEFTCSLCDYATSHKSNLERHMKIHESGDKYSTSSPSSSGQQHDRSSPEDFYQADDSSKSFCVPPPSRDHNPILASLLSQPANDGEVMQWIYHSPYDAYPSQMFNPPVNNNNTVGDPPAQQSAARRWSYDCQETRFESSTVAREVPLRHAIDVILGIKEELPKTRPGFLYCTGQDVNVSTSSCVVTTSSNHWSIGHLSALRQSNESPTFADASQSSHELNSDMDSSVSDHACASGHKRPWQMVDLYRSSLNQESLEDDFTYVPKKLRMSKRYQTGAQSP